MDIRENETIMYIGDNELELSIDNPKWLKLLQDGIMTIWEALRYLYGIRLNATVYDYTRGIGLHELYRGEKSIGRIFFTPDDAEALKRGETVTFLLV